MSLPVATPSLLHEGDKGGASRGADPALDQAVPPPADQRENEAPPAASVFVTDEACTLSQLRVRPGDEPWPWP